MSLKVKNLYEVKKEVEKKAKYFPLTSLELVERNINEASLDKVLDLHTKNGYIIISAFVESPNFDVYADYWDWLKVMLQRSEKLKNEIKKSGFTYIPVWGGYEYEDLPGEVHKEASFIVLNYKRNNVSLGEDGMKKLYSLGKKWCNTFNQVSFVYVSHNEEDEGALFFKHDGSSDGKFSGVAPTKVRGEIPTGEMVDMYFTRLGRERNMKITGKNSLSYNGYYESAKFNHKSGTIYLAESPYGMSQTIKRGESGELFLNFNWRSDNRSN